MHLKTTASDGVKVRFAIKEGSVAKEIHLDDVSFEDMDFFVENINHKEIESYWNAGNEMISATYSTDQAHTGAGSILADMPVSTTQTPVVRISTGHRREVLVVGQKYQASVWVKRKDAVDTDVRVGIVQHDGTTENAFDYPSSWTTLTTDDWTQIFSDEIVAAVGTLTVEPRIQGSKFTSKDFYIDDIVMLVEDPATAGVDDLGQFNFSYYPNPAKTHINVSATQTIDSVDLLNTIGQVVATTSINATSGVIEVADVASGVYILRATINGAVSAQRVVIE